jgi:hypothetical protein
MTRPLLEVADIVRAQGNRFIENNCRWIHWTHRKVLQAIARCRTAALGGHRDQCPRCGYRAISFNSCRNRHCPKCQSGARDKWIAARQNELLAVAYVHVVFTLPHQLSQLALQNKKVLYTSCSAPVRKLFWKLPATPSISEPRSVSSPYFIPGVRTYAIILTSTVWFRRGVCPRIILTGFTPAILSSYPWAY